MNRIWSGTWMLALVAGACTATAPPPPSETPQTGAVNGECRRAPTNSTCDRISSGLLATALNPQGRWSLGWQTALGSQLELFDSFRLDKVGAGSASGIGFWTRGITPRPSAALNPTCVPFSSPDGTQIDPGQVVLQPGLANQYSVARWSPGHSGAFHVRARFSGIGGQAQQPHATSEVHIRRGGADLAAGKINLDGAGNTFVYDDRVPIGAGQVIDFAVGTGNGDAGHDGTGIDIEICDSEGAL